MYRGTPARRDFRNYNDRHRLVSRSDFFLKILKVFLYVSFFVKKMIGETILTVYTIHDS